MAIDVNTVVVRVKADAAQFQQQMTGLEQQSTAAIARSQQAMGRLASMQMQAEAEALNSAKTTAKILTDAMSMMSSEANNLRAAMLNVQVAAQTSLNSIQHQRFLIQNDLAQISVAKSQIELDFARGMQQPSKDLARWQSLQARNQARMSGLAAQKAAVERQAVQDELRQFNFLGVDANLPEHQRNLQRDKLNVAFSTAANNASLYRRSNRRLDEQLNAELQLADVNRQRASAALSAFDLQNPGTLTGGAALQRQELAARATLADIAHERARVSMPNKIDAFRLQQDLNTLKQREIDLKRTQTQIDQDAARRLEPLQYRETLLKERMANNRAAQDQIKADMSIPTSQRLSKLADLSVEQRRLENGMAQVTQQMTQVKATASTKLQEIGTELKKVQSGQASTRSMLDANKPNTPQPFMWDWKGAMFGGMYGSVVGGRTGSLVGAGIGGLYGLPAGIAAATAMIPVHAIGSFLSAELHIAEKAATAFIHVVEHLGTKAIDLAMDWERLNVSFEVFTGNALKGKQTIEGIRNLSITTPFSMGQYASSAQMLLGYGIKSENILPSLSRLSDIAGGSPERLHRLALAFGQVQSHGRFMGQELRQFAEAGVGAGDFAETMGVSTKRFRELMHEGKVPVEVMIQTINRLTDAGGRFFEMNVRQLQTVSGSWHQLQETIDMTLQKLGSGFLKGFGAANAIQDMTFILNKELQGSNLEQTGENFGKQMSPLVDTTAATLMSFGPLFTSAVDSFGMGEMKAVDIIQTLGVTINQLADDLVLLNVGFALTAQTVIHLGTSMARAVLAISTAGGSEIVPRIAHNLGLTKYTNLMDMVIGQASPTAVDAYSSTGWEIRDGTIKASSDTVAGRYYDKLINRDPVTDFQNNLARVENVRRDAQKRREGQKAMLELYKKGQLPAHLIPAILPLLTGKEKIGFEPTPPELKFDDDFGFQKLFEKQHGNATPNNMRGLIQKFEGLRKFEDFYDGGKFALFQKVVEIFSKGGTTSDIGKHKWWEVIGQPMSRVGGFGFEGDTAAIGIGMFGHYFKKQADDQRAKMRDEVYESFRPKESSHDPLAQLQEQMRVLDKKRNDFLKDAPAGGWGIMPAVIAQFTRQGQAQALVDFQHQMSNQIPKDWRANYATAGSVEAQDAINAAQQNRDDMLISIDEALKIANDIHRKNEQHLEKAKNALEKMQQNGQVKVIQQGIN